MENKTINSVQEFQDFMMKYNGNSIVVSDDEEETKKYYWEVNITPIQNGIGIIDNENKSFEIHFDESGADIHIFDSYVSVDIGDVYLHIHSLADAKKEELLYRYGYAFSKERATKLCEMLKTGEKEHLTFHYFTAKHVDEDRTFHIKRIVNRFPSPEVDYMQVELIQYLVIFFDDIVDILTIKNPHKELDEFVKWSSEYLDYDYGNRLTRANGDIERILFEESEGDTEGWYNIMKLQGEILTA